MSVRCWEESRMLGRELSDLSEAPSRRYLAGCLRRLDHHFEIGTAPEEEAVHALIGGLVEALENGSAWPHNGDDDA